MKERDYSNKFYYKRWKNATIETAISKNSTTHTVGNANLEIVSAKEYQKDKGEENSFFQVV